MTNVGSWVCRYCGGPHRREQCPRVEEIWYDEDDKIQCVKLRDYDGFALSDFERVMTKHHGPD